MSEIIIYEDPDAPNPVQVTPEGDSVWLTQAQMAELFGRERSVITKHVRNVFRDGELNQEAVRAFFAHTAADGKTYQTEQYNLDVIISVGYRVKSSRGVRFRQWAASVLKDHLLNGYSLNRHRLAERGVEEVQAALDLLARPRMGSSLALTFLQQKSRRKRVETAKANEDLTPGLPGIPLRNLPFFDMAQSGHIPKPIDRTHATNSGGTHEKKNH